MIKIKRKPSGYWTKERCAEEAKKYKNTSAFRKNSGSACSVAYSNGWMNDIIKHMTPLIKPVGYWTKEQCAEEAKKYNNRVAFQKGCNAAYSSAWRKGLLDDICKHMTPLIKPVGYWTKERCAEEAKKYNTRNEFQKSNSSAYSIAGNNGWKDDICKHMAPVGSPYKRYVYVIEFENNSAYVGITWNIKERMQQHFDLKERGNRNVKENVKNKIRYTVIQSKLIDIEDAIKQENKWIYSYKENGWNVLNIAIAGSLGGMPVWWTKERCAEEAKKYKSRTEFGKRSSGAYTASRRNGWLDEVCKHMITIYKPAGYWLNKERCAEEAKKYKSRTAFKKGSCRAYAVSLKHGWLNDICKHMKEIYKPVGYWTKERCAEEAKKYKSRTAFAKGHRSAYSIAWKNKWLNDICKHIIPLMKPVGYWTKERCAEEAKKYKSRTAFQKGCAAAYSAAWKNKWLNDIN